MPYPIQAVLLAVAPSATAIAISFNAANPVSVATENLELGEGKKLLDILAHVHVVP